MPQLHKRLPQLKSSLWSELPGENRQLQEEQERWKQAGQGGEGGKWRIRGKKKTKRENPRERKTEMFSEAITSKRFEKVQDCLTEISLTLLSKLRYSAHVQVSHLSGQ